MVKSPIVRLTVTSPSPPPTTSPTPTTSPVSLSLSATHGGFPSSVTATISVSDPETGNPVPNAKVLLYITNGTDGPVGLTTNSSGVATYTFTPPGIAGYLFLAEYNGMFSNSEVYMAGFDTYTPPLLPVVVTLHLNNGNNLGVTGSVSIVDSSGVTVYSSSFSDTFDIPSGLNASVGSLEPGNYTLNFSGKFSSSGVALPSLSNAPFSVVEGTITRLTIDVPPAGWSPIPNQTGTFPVYIFGSPSGYSVAEVTSLTNGESGGIGFIESGGGLAGNPIQIPPGNFVVHLVPANSSYSTYIFGNTQLVIGWPVANAVVAGDSPYGYVPQSLPYSWGTSDPDDEYLVIGCWTNPSIIARCNINTPGHPWTGFGLSKIPSWGYNHVVYGGDGYIYVAGLFNSPGSGAGPGLNTCVAKYSVDDLANPVWTSMVDGGFIYGLTWLNGYVYMSQYQGEMFKISASDGSVVAQGTVGTTSVTNVFSYNELHTDGTRLWRQVQGGMFYEFDPDTLAVINSGGGSYGAAFYNDQDGHFYAASSYAGTSPSGAKASAIVDMIDPSTYKVLARWYCPFTSIFGNGAVLPTSISADSKYVYVGYYQNKYSTGAVGNRFAAAPGRVVLNTTDTVDAQANMPVDVLSIDESTPGLTYLGTLYVGGYTASGTMANGEKIREIWNVLDGRVYIEDDDANGQVYVFDTSTWDLDFVVVHPAIYSNVVNSGTPAQPRYDSWEEIRDYCITKYRVF